MTLGCPAGEESGGLQRRLAVPQRGCPSLGKPQCSQGGQPDLPAPAALLSVCQALAATVAATAAWRQRGGAQGGSGGCPSGGHSGTHRLAVAPQLLPRPHRVWLGKSAPWTGGGCQLGLWQPYQIGSAPRLGLWPLVGAGRGVLTGWMLQLLLRGGNCTHRPSDAGTACMTRKGQPLGVKGVGRPAMEPALRKDHVNATLLHLFNVIRIGCNPNTLSWE